MKIYLLRHGIAENGRPNQPDSERALTGEGRDQLRETLAVARKADTAPSLIITSPYRRAVETAPYRRRLVFVAGRRNQTLRSQLLNVSTRPSSTNWTASAARMMPSTRVMTLLPVTPIALRIQLAV